MYICVCVYTQKDLFSQEYRNKTKKGQSLCIEGKHGKNARIPGVNILVLSVAIFHFIVMFATVSRNLNG